MMIMEMGWHVMHVYVLIMEPVDNGPILTTMKNMQPVETVKTLMKCAPSVMRQIFMIANATLSLDVSMLMMKMTTSTV